MIKRYFFSLFCIILVSLFLSSVSPALAQDFSASDVIAAVNDLRAKGSLAPYQVDSGLMDYAQQHSEYQASINTSTHQHSDGTLPWSKGLIENVAAGGAGFLTVNDIISAIWADALHMKTMVGFSSGYIGVGIASNDTTTFVTLDLQPGSAAPAVDAPQSVLLAASTQTTSTPAPFVPIITNTPLSDGSIVHVVVSGETLWQIAISYGVKVNDIRSLNGLAAGSNSIYVGQKLKIRPAVTATPTLPVTPSATATHEPSRTPRPPTPTHAPTSTATRSPSPTPTKAPFLPVSNLPDNKTIALGLIGIGVIGLAVLVITGFRK
jgi:LysM repeat protein